VNVHEHGRTLALVAVGRNRIGRVASTRHDLEKSGGPVQVYI
jgi:hypothetical protein